jgi:hypothetical protein
MHLPLEGSSGVLDPDPCAGDECCEVETVGRAGCLLVRLQTVRCALDEPGGTDGVAARPVGQANAQLGQALPQLALLVGARLPPDLESLMCREGTTLVQQRAGVGQGRFRAKELFRDGLDAGCPIRQGTSERVAWSSLLCSSLLVSIAIASHVSHQASGDGLELLMPSEGEGRPDRLGADLVLVGAPVETDDVHYLESAASCIHGSGGSPDRN